MSLDSIRRRLDKIERRAGPPPLGRLPAAWIVTEDDEDRDRQLAALTAAGKYEPGRLVIDWRIVDPDARMKELDRELRQPVPPSHPH